VAESLGYTDPAADRAHGFLVRDDVLRHIRAQRRGPDRWAWLSEGRLAAVAFYYRTSPRRLVPLRPAPRPFVNDPPLMISGMVSMLLDTEGRLVQFLAVPPQRDADAPPAAGASPANWAPLLAAAGFSEDRLTEAEAEWTPPVYADFRAAWTTTLAELGDLPLRIEAASYRGRPVYFNVVGPWTRPSRMEPPPQSAVGRAATAITAAMVALVLVVAFVMARNNLRSGRGDRDGAVRLGVVVLVMGAASWVLGAHHVADAAQELDHFLVGMSLVLLQAGIIWLAYMALEPLVRRRWPTGIIGWTRLVAGEWRDPLVGRDVLIGLAAGVGLGLALRGTMFLLTWLGVPPPTPGLVNFESFGGVHLLLSLLLGAMSNVLATSLVVVLLFVVIRLVVRWAPLAFAGATLLLALLIGGEIVAGEVPALEISMALGVAAFVAAVAWRYGLLALAATLTVNQLTFVAPVVTDLATWYAPQTLTVLALLVGLAVVAFVNARAGEPMLGRRVLAP
jgi:serine/threonine-protein kinase